MKHLKRSLRLPLADAHSGAIGLFMLLALLGFADATYLTVEHFRGVIPPCSVTEGCATVLTSQYSVVLGMPVSLLGSLYYLTIAVGAFLYLESKHGSGKISRYHSMILKGTYLMTALGFLMSLWFVYLQLVILKSICIYCMGSATTSILLFLVAIYMLRNSSKAQPEAPISLIDP